MSDDLRALRAEVAELRKSLRTAVRERQLAEAKASQTKASHDRRELVKAMAEGAFITWPEDEPALGVKAGETFQKRGGKLVPVKTFIGQPVKETSYAVSGSLDFTKERRIQKERAES